MTSFLKTAATGLAASLHTLSATASAQAPDPECRFRISAQMDGSLDPSPRWLDGSGRRARQREFRDQLSAAGHGL